MEWNKREHLETEKISLERENKLLKAELNELRERVDSRKVRPASSCEGDKRILQQDFLDCSKVSRPILIKKATQKVPNNKKNNIKILLTFWF